MSHDQNAYSVFRRGSNESPTDEFRCEADVF